MCGICGILGFTDDFVVDEPTVVRMRDTLAHRGPDDAGAIVRAAQRVALGHRRLSIVDLSSAGHQPMGNEDGTVWIVYNGEVYNHEALRAELEASGYRYRSHTDSETILHLYEEEGPRCVERLDGMFAFAIWDSRRRELFLARDRIGVKPLYYAQLPGGLVFGSELKAILAHPAIVPDLDEQAFADYLTFAFTPPPRTMFAGISKLAPGERMTVAADGSERRETWWDPLEASAAISLAGASEDEMVTELRSRLEASIAKRMMSDVQLGVFLSGGLDSSTNVALMSELMDRPVRTYSTAPKGHPRHDELRYARLVAKRFATDHHEIVIDEQDVRDFIPQLLDHQDEPNADWTSIPQHYVTKLARDDGTIVVHAGEGADEILHGYKGYEDHRRVIVPLQRYVPKPLRRAVGSAAVGVTSRLGRGVVQGEAVYDGSRSRVPYWGGALCFRGPLKERILTNGGGSHARESVERIWDDADVRHPGADLFQHMTYVELRQRLPELLLMRLDKIAMAGSVEAREPFLDHRLVAYALALPPRMKHRDGVGKWALRRAMAGRLPDEVLNRPKQGFGTPMDEWLRGDFGIEVHAAVMGSALAERGLLDYGVVDELFASHRAGRGDWSKHLWTLYSVSAWYDRWIAAPR